MIVKQQVALEMPDRGWTLPMSEGACGFDTFVARFPLKSCAFSCEILKITIAPNERKPPPRPETPAGASYKP